MKIYYGWFIVAISALVFAIVVGATMQAFGLFVLPVSDAFDLSRAEVNTAVIVLNIGMAFAGLIIGRMLDRNSIRLIMLASAVTFGVSLFALSLSDNIWLSSAILFVPLALGVVGCGTLTAPAIVARWFTVYRARAMAITTGGISLGPIIVVPLIGFGIETMGWRNALAATGIVTGALLVALSLLVRNAPGPGDVEPGLQSRQAAPAPNEPAVSTTPLAVGELLRMPMFWTFGVGAAMTFAVMVTLLVSLVPYAQESGLSLTEAAALMSTYGAASIAGTLLFAVVGDRVNKLLFFAGVAFLLGAGGAALLLAPGALAMHLCVALLGLASGAITPAFLSVCAEKFGVASFGVVTGCASFLSTVISAVAVRLGGEVYDRTGGYDVMLFSFLVFGTVSAVLILAMGPLSKARPAAPQGALA